MVIWRLFQLLIPTRESPSSSLEANISRQMSSRRSMTTRSSSRRRWPQMDSTHRLHHRPMQSPTDPHVRDNRIDLGWGASRIILLILYGALIDCGRRAYDSASRRRRRRWTVLKTGSEDRYLKKSEHRCKWNASTSSVFDYNVCSQTMLSRSRATDITRRRAS